MTSDLLNRPMLDEDVRWAETNEWSVRIQSLVSEYAKSGLPVMNGDFLYSNLREGRDQMFTCNPYRLWEYSSLFLLFEPQRPWRSFLDVGGAASALPYFLAESGIRGEAFDLQPALTAVCNHVAAVRAIPLSASTADVVQRDPAVERVELVTCVSVIEHIPIEGRDTFLRAMHRVLEPAGLLYLTFDYGDYVERDRYRRADGEPLHDSASVSDLRALWDAIENAGFTFVGDDPRALPAELAASRAAPRTRAVMKRFAVTSQPFDARTPWKDVAKYVAKRLLPMRTLPPVRFDRHNFFRVFLRRAS